MIVAVKYDCIAITGRFQPFHLDHMDLVQRGLSLATDVIIGITNPDRRSWKSVSTNAHRHRASANPFTYLERVRIIDAALQAARVPSARYNFVPFPLDDSRVWSDYVPYSTPQLVRAYSDWEHDKAQTLQSAGYKVELIEGDPDQKISASQVRAAMAAGESWQQWLPQGAVQVLSGLSGGNLKQRCGCVDGLS